MKLYLGECIMVVGILFIIGLVIVSAVQSYNQCEKYSDMNINDIPAKCVDYFSPHQTTGYPIIINTN